MHGLAKRVVVIDRELHVTLGGGSGDTFNVIVRIHIIGFRNLYFVFHIELMSLAYFLFHPHQQHLPKATSTLHPRTPQNKAFHIFAHTFLSARTHVLTHCTHTRSYLHAHTYHTRTQTPIQRKNTLLIHAPTAVFSPKSLEELKRAVDDCTCSANSNGRLDMITGMYDHRKTLRSFIAYPNLRKDYRKLSETDGQTVDGTLHGLGLDTEHPLVNVKAQSKNYFVAVLHKAFTDHLPITLRPDDLWLTILQGLAIHVNMDTDKLRALILKDASKEDKHELRVRDDNLKLGDLKNDWSHVFGSFTSQIEEQTVKGTTDVLGMGFSTSTPTTTMAGQCALFKVLASYFDYHTLTNHTLTMCGIPEIFLSGSPYDWTLLRKKVEMLRAYDLDWWVEHLIPICDEFVLLSWHLHEQEELSVASIQFWSSIYHYDNLSGGPLVTGWVTALFPYLTDQQARFIPNSKIDWNGRAQYKENKKQLLELRAQILPHDPATAGKIAKLQAQIRAFNEYKTTAHGSDSGISPGSFPPGYTVAPLQWTHRGREIEAQMNGGFFGSAQNPKTYALEPVIGWCVSEGNITLM